MRSVIVRGLGGPTVGGEGSEVKLDYLRKHLGLGRAPAWLRRAATTTTNI